MTLVDDTFIKLMLKIAFFNVILLRPAKYLDLNIPQNRVVQCIPLANFLVHPSTDEGIIVWIGAESP